MKDIQYIKKISQKGYDLKIMCAVYGSVLHDEMYIYMPKNVAFETLPDALRSRFGKPRKAMEILLVPGKNLANVSVDKILEAFKKQGFYLQLPPAKKENWLEEFRSAQSLPDQDDGGAISVDTAREDSNDTKPAGNGPVVD